MVVIKKPGMLNENEETEPEVDIAESVSDASSHDNEGTVSDGVVVEKETTIDTQRNEDQPSSGLEPVGSKIKGWEETLAAKPMAKKIRILKLDSNSWNVHKEIAKYAEQANQEYLPTTINEALKRKYDLLDSDISSYYYAKKKSGYLDNRELTPEESKKMKKSVRIWWTTDLFWEVYEATKERIAEEQAKKHSDSDEAAEKSKNTGGIVEDVFNSFDES